MSNQEAFNAATKLIDDQTDAALSELNDQAEAAMWPSGSRVYATAAWPHRLPSDVILTSSDVI